MGNVQKGTGNNKQGKHAGKQTLCRYRNFSQAINIFIVFVVNRSAIDSTQKDSYADCFNLGQ